MAEVIDVSTPNEEYNKSLPNWNLVTALMGGTANMRAKGETYLPRNEMEEQTDYANRLSLTTLYPAYSETVANAVGRVFAEPLSRSEDIPQWITDEVLDDIDREGSNVDVFACQTFTKAFAEGVSFVFVDAPKKIKPDGTEVITLADQKAAKIRPYCILIGRERVIGWKQVAGVLKQVRIKFEEEKPDPANEFGTICVEQIRVFEPRRCRIYEKDNKGAWSLAEETANDLDIIPLIPFYTNKTGFFCAKPQLMELAFLNAKHWRQQSDKDSLLHTASVPVLASFGLESGVPITIGSKIALNLPFQSKLEYVEHTGKAIEAGEKALEALKQDMKEAGMRLLLRTDGQKTATQVGEEADSENSILGRIVRDFRDALSMMLDYIALYRKEQDGGTLTPEANLDPDVAPIESFQCLADMNAGGKLSDETYFNEAKRRSFIAEDVEWEDEQARISAQPPPANALTLTDPATGLPLPPVPVKPAKPTPPAPEPTPTA